MTEKSHVPHVLRRDKVYEGEELPAGNFLTATRAKERDKATGRERPFLYVWWAEKVEGEDQ